MAFGLIDGLEPVDMLVGAGNAYVAEAKRQLFGRVGIDLLAGPDRDPGHRRRVGRPAARRRRSARPGRARADLAGGLHRHRRVLAHAVCRRGRRAAADAGRRRTSPAQAWRDHGWIAVAADDDEAVALADDAAYEHLEVQVSEDKLDWYLDRLSNYGSLFLGDQATVAYGDKAVGTNHVLPTSRAARYTGGLWVGKFLKTCTYQRLTEEGTQRVAPAVAAISHAEHFEGHALTAEVRLERVAQTAT